MRKLPEFLGRSANHCIHNQRGRSTTPKFVTLPASIERAPFPIFYARWNHWNQCHFRQLKAFHQVLWARSLLSILARRLTLMCIYKAKMAPKDDYISRYKKTSHPQLTERSSLNHWTVELELQDVKSKAWRHIELSINILNHKATQAGDTASMTNNIFRIATRINTER